MYIDIAVPSCFWFDKQLICRAFSRAWAKTGKRIAARIAIIAITTSSSIRVNPRFRIGIDSFRRMAELGGEDRPGGRWAGCFWFLHRSTAPLMRRFARSSEVTFLRAEETLGVR